MRRPSDCGSTSRNLRRRDSCGSDEEHDGYNPNTTEEQEDEGGNGADGSSFEAEGGGADPFDNEEVQRGGDTGVHRLRQLLWQEAESNPREIEGSARARGSWVALRMAMMRRPSQAAAHHLRPRRKRAKRSRRKGAAFTSTRKRRKSPLPRAFQGRQREQDTEAVETVAVAMAAAALKTPTLFTVLAAAWRQGRSEKSRTLARRLVMSGGLATAAMSARARWKTSTTVRIAAWWQEI